MDTALKQRLIGAVVLVALAVIFLPMLIKGPAPDSGVSDVPLTVPATPGGQYETRELPLVTPGDAPAGGVVGMDSGAPAAAPSASEASASEAIALGAAPAASNNDAMLPASTAGGNFAVTRSMRPRLCRRGHRATQARSYQLSESPPPSTQYCYRVASDSMPTRRCRSRALAGRTGAQRCKPTW